MSDIVVIPQPQPFAIPSSYGAGGTTGAKGDPGSPGEGYATRTAMAARLAPALHDDVYLTEAGREGKFVVDLASSWTAQIAADTAQARFVASTADATKVYRRVGDPSILHAGAKADGTDAGPAIMAAQAAARGTAVTGFGYGEGSGTIRVPKPDTNQAYYISTTVDLTTTAKWLADGVGNAGGWSTVFQVAPDITGVRFQSYGTTDDTGTYTPTDPNDHNALGSIIDGLGLRGSWNSTTHVDNATARGCLMRAKGAWRDFQIANFQGVGIELHAGVGLPEAGNANNSELSYGVFQNNLIGLKTGGSDTNACIFTGLQFIGMRQQAVEDASGTLNLYIGCLNQISGFHPTNDGTSGKPVSVVTLSGHYYTPRRGQLAAAQTTSPSGTTSSTTEWIYFADGAAGQGAPTWVSGIALAYGGSFFITTGAVLLNPYDEEGGPPAQFGPGTLRIAGTGFSHAVGGASLVASGNQIQVNDVRVTSGNLLLDDDGSGILQIGRYAPGNPAYLRPAPAAPSLTIRSPDNGDKIVIANSQLDLYSVSVLAAALRPATDNAVVLGGSGHRYTELWAASATIQTSDRQHKTAVRPLTDAGFDALLDAVGAVPLVAFKFKDAVAAKGDAARDHYGIVAQDLHDELVKRGLDPFAGGVLGRDPVMEEVEEEHEVERGAMRTEFVKDFRFEMVDGKMIRREVLIEKKMPDFEHVPVHDENGDPIIQPAIAAHKDALGEGVPAVPARQLTHPVRRMEKATEKCKVSKPKLNNGKPDMIWSVRYAELAALQFAWMQRELRK